MNQKVIRVLIWICVILFLLGIGKDFAIQTVFVQGLQTVTDLKMKVKGFHLGIFDTVVHIKGLRLFNPKGYEEKVMVDMPQIYIDANLPSLLKGTVHIEKVRLELKTLQVVKNHDGELNIDALKPVQTAEPKEKKEKVGPGHEMALQIDRLHLQIKQVRYKDYSVPKGPLTKIFDLNFDEEFENITNLNMLIRVILIKALINTTIGKLPDFDMDILSDQTPVLR